MATVTSDTTQPSAREQPRLFAFDAARAIAALFVIAIHVPGGKGMMAFSEAARFAVPLFFAISGYFFVRSQETAAMARLARLLKLYLFWVAAYLVADHFLHFWKTEHPAIDLIFGGGAGFHLWFISGLIQCLALYYLLRVRLKLVNGGAKVGHGAA